MEKQFIPQLRFPEFEGSWEEKKLGTIAKVERGKFTPRPRNNPIYYNGEIPFVQTGDVVTSNGYIKKYSQTLNKEGLKVSKLFKKGTILITIAANIGFTGVLEIDVACPDSLIGLSCNEGIYNYFLNILLIREQRKMDYLAVAAAQKNINIDFLKPYRLSLPTLPEQEKIASFLSSVDTKISQLSKKKALLEQYKKGIMQQIFSQQIRFKDENGEEFPQWEEKKLGEVCSIFDGTHQTPKYVDKGVPFYSVEHVTANQFSNTKFVTEDAFEKENKRVTLNKGDILMTRIGSIGKAKYIDWDVKASFYVSLALIKSSEKISSLYLSHYINADKFQRELWQRTIHVAFPQKINLGEIGQCIIAIPSTKEQQKIAYFLTSLDQKIEQVGKQLSKAQDFKKGLLQQMFV